MYIVSVMIGDDRRVNDVAADFKTLYRAARSLVRFGKRWQIRTGVTIRDKTGITIARFYSLESKRNGKWVAALSVFGKYNTHIDF
jgi:hypothetical protein